MEKFNEGDKVVFTCPANGREYLATVQHVYGDGDIAMSGPDIQDYRRDVGMGLYANGWVIADSCHVRLHVEPDTLAKLQALYDFTEGEAGSRISFYGDRLVAWKSTSSGAEGNYSIYGPGKTLVEMIDKAYSALQGVRR